MARAQNFTGNYNSKANQLNGNHFHGHVTINPPDTTERHHPKPTQNNPKSESAGYMINEFTEKTGSRASGILNWDDCAQSLAFEESNDRERVIVTQSAGTCEWLLKSPKYLRWIDERGLFLIRGKPGSGKSTLLKYALCQQPEAVTPLGSVLLSFFFFANGSELQRSILGLFRSLLLQLLEQDEDSKSAFMSICGRRCKPGEKEKPQLNWHQVELENHFQKLVIDCSARRKILIYVDALDECNDKDRDRLISSFHTLRGERLNRPAIFVTCRPYPDGQIKADFQIRLEEENQNDIQSFVEHNLRLPDETAEEADELKRTLLSKAEGLFLWLVLIIPQIHEMSSKGLSLRRISSEILECPRELDGLYEGLLNKIEKSELLEAIALFHWICFAARPLSLNELRIALTVNLSASKSSLKEYGDGDNPQLIANESKMRKRMTYLTRGLVESKSDETSEGKNVVGFHHDTIRDFMRKKGLNFLKGRMPDRQGVAKSANVQLANTCLLYLSTDEIRGACLKKTMLSGENFGFLGYAAMFWLSHAVAAERERLGGTILWPDEAIIGLWIKIHNSLWQDSEKNPIEGTTLMHIAAQYELENLAKRIITKEERISAALGHTILRRGDISSSISEPTVKTEKKSRLGKDEIKRLTIRRSRQEATESLGRRENSQVKAIKREISVKMERDERKSGAMMGLRKGKDKEGKEHVNVRNQDGDLPLHLAAEHGSLMMVKFLYRSGSEITELNHRKCTPIYKGSKNGHLEVVKFLFEHGADIHTTTNGGWTPFCAASDSGHLEVVKFLFEHRADADIHTATNDGLTPFCAASDSGHLEVVKFLFEHGADADIHTATNNGWTPFCAASESGHLEVMKFLFKHGADIHTTTNDGWTPFYAASYSGHLEVVKFLFEHRADIHTATNDGWTPFYAASDSGHLEVVKFLFNHRADTDIHTATDNGRTLFYAASNSGHLEVVKFLFEHGADADIHTATNDGRTPFYAASNSGHLEVVKFLFEHGVDADIHTATNNGWNPFCAASNSGHLEVVKFLFEHRADADIHTTTNDGWTPFCAASYSGHLEVVKFLFEHGADIHTATNDGWTPFCAASYSGHLEVVKFLFEHGADADIHTATNNGWTPFCAASDSGHLEVVKFLFEHRADADIHTAINNGITPFCAASNSGHLEVVKFLFEHGADADIHTTTNDGWTPFCAASDSGHLEVVKFLFEHGADADIHTTTNDGWTPFCAASDSGHLEVVKFLFNHRADTDIHTATDNGRTPFYAASNSGHLEVVKFLFEHGADADIHTAINDGWTPFFAASNSGHLEVVKFLFEHGADADIHTTTNDGWTPFCAASDSGHLEVVKFLFEHGADTDIHTATNDGRTPFYAASDSGHLEVVKFLFEHGADTDIHTAINDGWTPFFAASNSGHLEVVKFLFEHGADIHTATDDGLTPFCAASDSGHLEVVKFLFEHGADTDIQTRTHYGPTTNSVAV
ncbi:hypothetical protein N7495_008305 [Penicillium taxi]|uniref:uncharacterized protein n=1 Tax=Penicillium taxi TaxID=168475 RepID=UPI0025454220|nr:uncharacterized protein N7495_008305 [Penicillium taxi]KAJ5888264.1 hypothetical protein N7495_008305 [Penicillium taxi]